MAGTRTVLGLKRNSLHSLAYRGGLASRGSFKILDHNLGDAVRNAPLRLAHPAFCPKCVSEAGYLDAFWDLSAAVACPIHESAVLTICPACRARIGWQRPGLLTCCCGGSLLAATLPVASPLVLDLVALLQSRLHGHTSSIPNPRGLPLNHLAAMPFSALLHLVTILGDIAASAKTSRHGRLSEPSVQRSSVIKRPTPTKRSAPECPSAQVAAAARVLSDWPHGYHDLLRTLGEHNLASGQKSIGMRRQFAEFYERLLKSRSAMREHGAFLREEFIAFGLQHWGKGIIDPRMLRDKDVLKTARFVSKSEIARQNRLWKPTVRKMTQSGALAGFAVKMRGAERAVVDVRNISIPDAVTAIINVRSAAKRLGLTVRVLKGLKAHRIYTGTERRGFAASWFADDIDAFRSRLLALAPISTGRRRSGTVTLNDVVRKSTVPVETRVALVSALLNHSLKPRGRSGPSPAGILLRRQDIDAFIEGQLKPLLGSTCSLEDCSRTTGLCRSAVADAVRAGHLVQTVVRGYKRITAASVEQFRSSYLPLAAIAKENHRSPRLLVTLTRRKHLPLIFVARAHHASPQGFICRSSRPQLMAAMAEYEADQAARRTRGNNRAAHEVRLREYCTQRIESGQGLPRKGGVPKKCAIALACGFSRDVFYDIPRMQRLLEEFDRKERAMHPRRCLGSFEIVRDYIAKLDRAGRPLPLWSGRPNALRISKECGIRRQAIQGNAKIQKLLNDFARRHGALNASRER